jgi:SAM-dependent methyltransferase
MAHDHGHQHDTDSAALGDLLDLDAEVLHAYLAEVIDWVHSSAGDLAGGRILDVGAGTGTGAVALARRFPAAEVTAVDLSAEFLDRLRHKAHGLGLGERIRTVQADLDGPWPRVGPVDLAWASNSMHHMADPDRALGEVFAALRPGGLLAVAELNSFPRFLPDGGFEERCLAALRSGLASEVPHLGADWGAHLPKAGFAVEAERTFAIEVSAPLPAATGRYAEASLRRMRPGLEGRVSPADLAAFDALLDDGPGGVALRDDLIVRASRTVWLARRP